MKKLLFTFFVFSLSSSAPYAAGLSVAAKLFQPEAKQLSSEIGRVNYSVLQKMATDVAQDSAPQKNLVTYVKELLGPEHPFAQEVDLLLAKDIKSLTEAQKLQLSQVVRDASLSRRRKVALEPLCREACSPSQEDAAYGELFILDGLEKLEDSFRTRALIRAKQNISLSYPSVDVLLEQLSLKRDISLWDRFFHLEDIPYEVYFKAMKKMSDARGLELQKEFMPYLTAEILPRYIDIFLSLHHGDGQKGRKDLMTLLYQLRIRTESNFLEATELLKEVDSNLATFVLPKLASRLGPRTPPGSVVASIYDGLTNQLLTSPSLASREMARETHSQYLESKASFLKAQAKSLEEKQQANQ